MDAASPAIPEPFFALHPVELEIGVGAPRRQDRVTVAFRALLVLPHVLVLSVLSLVAIPLVVVGWFAALVLGRLPRWIATYVMSVIAYAVRVTSYGFMLAGEFPSFSLSHSEYPVAVKVGASQLSRVKVFFRLLLVIPAYVVTAIAGNGLLLLSPVIWLVTLVLGRTPQSFFGAAAAVIRYQARYSAYMGLVTDTYPRRLFGDAAADLAPEGFRVSRSRGTEVVTGVIIVLGIATTIGGLVLDYESRPKPNPAIGAAEARLEFAQGNWFLAEDNTTCNLECRETHDRNAARAFSRFASSISEVPFPVSQIGQVETLVSDSRAIGRTLLVVSKLKTGAAHDDALLRIQPFIDSFDSEAAKVLGPGLEGIIR